MFYPAPLKKLNQVRGQEGIFATEVYEDGGRKDSIYSLPCPLFF
jgi:hypothetical protein